MSSKPILSLKEAREHLSRIIPRNVKGRQLILDLIERVIDWNSLLPEGEKLFGYLREGYNIGFSIDAGGNREKLRKPWVFIVKLPGTDRDFKDFLVDFYLKESGNTRYNSVLTHRPSNKICWTLLESSMNKLNLDDLEALVTISHRNRLM